MAVRLDIAEAVLAALKAGVQTPDALSLALWPDRADARQSRIDAGRLLDALVAGGSVELCRCTDGDIYIPRVNPGGPRWFFESSAVVIEDETAARTTATARAPVARRAFDAEKIVSAVRSRFGVIAAAIEMRTGERAATTLHYVGGASDRDNEFVGELEGIETAMERFMDEWEWPSNDTAHQWHDPRLPLVYPFVG